MNFMRKHASEEKLNTKRDAVAANGSNRIVHLSADAETRRCTCLIENQ